MGMSESGERKRRGRRANRSRRSLKIAVPPQLVKDTREQPPQGPARLSLPDLICCSAFRTRPGKPRSAAGGRIEVKDAIPWLRSLRSMSATHVQMAVVDEK